MKLAQLLTHGDVTVWPNSATKNEIESTQVNKITMDSRACRPGTLFVAVRGATSESLDGHAFIGQAIELGACALVVESASELPSGVEIPVLLSNNCRKLIANCSEQIHDSPSKKLKISGVTGTNGKTSVTFFLASILKAAGQRPSVLGTLGIGDVDNPKVTGFTTPEAEVLSAAIAQLAEHNYSHVAMEVSSHALALYRCDGIHFAAAAFLNLSEDHLDFHGTMSDYRKAKERLFLELLPKSSPAIIPVTDPLLCVLRERNQPIVSFGRSSDADIHISNIVQKRTGTQVCLQLGADRETIEIPVFGDYNLDNIMAACGLALAQNLTSQVIFEALSEVKSPPGRLEKVRAGHSKSTPLVFVDFAHSPDALLKVLVAARPLAARKLRLVFGCGGNRDRQKRPLMGKIAAMHADEILITHDNPRHENPDQIIEDICLGIPEALRNKIRIIPDRKEAILEAIGSAHVDDVVILAGKGHETTQQIGDEYRPFSDMRVAQEALEDW